MTMFRLRDAINEGLTLGPRMILCGRPISIIGGHMGYFGGEVTGENDCRAMARQLIKEGADYLKITATGGSTPSSFPLRPAFNVNELRAITDEAHKFGKLTATHSTATQGIINSLDAEVDMIIHCVYQEPDGEWNFRQDIAERIGEQGAYVNPTLHVGRARIWSLIQLERENGSSDEDRLALDETKRELEVRLEDNRRMIEMGVKVITGPIRLGAITNWATPSTRPNSSSTLVTPICKACCPSPNGRPRPSASMTSSERSNPANKPTSSSSTAIPATNVNDLWNVVDVFSEAKAGPRFR